MKLKKDKLYPGQLVHFDQFESSVGGRLLQSFDKEEKLEKLKGGTVFMTLCLHISILINKSPCKPETLSVGNMLLRILQAPLVSPLNPIGTTIMSSILKRTNRIVLNKIRLLIYAVGTHHQNGVAERAIQTVTNWARALLINAAIRWPDEVDLDLWLFPMTHAVWICHNIPKQNVGFSHTEPFTGVRSDQAALNCLHV